MANYLLVQGGNMPTEAWNKMVKKEEYPPGEFMGGKIWDKVVLELRSNNHKVFAPTLLDANKHNLSDHINQISSLIEENKLKDIILVGSSYGGMIITGIANKIGNKIALLVYLDAVVPKPGESLFDILISAKYEPKPVLENFSMAYLEKIYFDPKKLEDLFKIYVQCTESSFLPVSNLIIDKISHEKKWSIFKLATSHSPMATMPNKLVELLLGFAKKVTF